MPLPLAAAFFFLRLDVFWPSLLDFDDSVEHTFEDFAGEVLRFPRPAPPVFDDDDDDGGVVVSLYKVCEGIVGSRE